MKTNQIRWAPVLLGIAALALVGCSDKSTDDGDQSSAETDEQALIAMMTEDVELDDVDSWASDDTGGGSTDEVISPLRWARIGHRSQVAIVVEFSGDTLATITRTRQWNGVLRLVTDTTGGVPTAIEKPMYNTCVRKAHAIRVDRTRFPRLNWRITEVTPETLESSTPNPHTVSPIRLQVIAASDSGPVTLLDLTDPLNTYLNRETVLTVSAEQELTIKATANLSDPAFSVLHPFAYRAGRLVRLPLLDDGVSPDEVAGDGVYTGSYLAPSRPGLFHAAIDFMDWETMYDSEGPYDAGGWACPYRVIG
ncbi:hypothetical protein HZB60_12770 [candidate division KSB1 bacterium]|nr:hypothetical protein [candidate division KSB1 bacterium]